MGVRAVCWRPCLPCSGIGFALAVRLAATGFHVVLGCRSAARGSDAVARLVASLSAVHPGVERRVSTALLDVASLASVRGLCEELGKRYSP